MTLRTIIVEDEIPAQITLKKMLDRCCDDCQIIATFTSVRATVKWLEENPSGVDVIFMDVELSDGVCFDIFKQTTIEANVIITTAYESYAVNAFKINSVDYLLKPIAEQDLKRAWERCRKSAEARNPASLEALLDYFTQAARKGFKKRFIVKVGEKIVIIPVDQIAYCYSEDKNTYAVTRNATRRLLDYSLDTVQEMLDPSLFFRISRSYIVSIDAIDNISRHMGTRLKLQLTPPHRRRSGRQPQPDLRLLGVARQQLSRRPGSGTGRLGRGEERRTGVRNRESGCGADRRNRKSGCGADRQNRSGRAPRRPQQADTAMRAGSPAGVYACA